MSVFIRQVNLIQLVDDIKEKKNKQVLLRRRKMCQQIAFRLKLQYHVFPCVFSLLALELPISSLSILSLTYTHSYVIVLTISSVVLHTPKSCTPFSLCGPQACSFFVGSSFSGFQNASVPRIMSWDLLLCQHVLSRRWLPQMCVPGFLMTLRSLALISL